MAAKPPSQPPRRARGFKQASSLLQQRIRVASESRGFAVSRLLTHWDEIAGPDFAGVCRPVDVRYGRGGFGATLTLLTTGANAPMLEMGKERLRERVNACYGYAAISRIRLTQTAPDGFGEGAARFEPAPKPKAPDPEITREAAQTAADIGDKGLRDALEQLARNVLTQAKSR